ncbi:hypothetical protein ABZP36_022545 [Zizania latifolia]
MVVVGIRRDAASRELLTWALVKVASAGDRVVALHVTADGALPAPAINLELMVCGGSSIRKTLVKEAASYGVAHLILGVAKNSLSFSCQVLRKESSRSLFREVVSKELLEISQAVYALFAGDNTESNVSEKVLHKRNELKNIVGYSVQDSILKKLAQLAQMLRSLQRASGCELVHRNAEDTDENDVIEFGSSFDFKPPSRFIVDVSLDDDLSLECGGLSSKPFENEQYDACSNFTSRNSISVGDNMNLRWLKDQCNLTTRSGGSMLSGDELAKALCRVLLSNKAGDEIADELLDLVGDAAFETVQDLLLEIRHLCSYLQDLKNASAEEMRRSVHANYAAFIRSGNNLKGALPLALLW